MGVSHDEYFVADHGHGWDSGSGGLTLFPFAAFSTNDRTNYLRGVLVTGQEVGVSGQAGDLPGPAARLFGGSGAAGVFGTSDVFPGVIGTSRDGPGVYGQRGAVSGSLPAGLPSAGVIGASEAWNGVTGWAQSGDGVFGQSDRGYGVRGISNKFYGVCGQFGDPGPFPTNTPGALGAPIAGPPEFKNAGVLGTSQNAIGTVGTSYTREGVLGLSRDAAGVSGTSQNAPGVSGGSGAVGVFGVSGAAFGTAGWSLAPSGTGVIGISGKAGLPLPSPFNTSTAAVVASSDANPGVIAASQAGPGIVAFSTDNFAGYFVGDLKVTGRITAGVKDAVVPFPDGSQRMLHCMESPEHWFEDFGSARLARGRAIVKLDADFAKVVKLNEYRVFLTPEGDCQGLYVKNRRGSSFEVRELQGGTSRIAFSYRVVGKRKDIKAHKRFAKVDEPAPAPSARARTARGRKAAQAPSSIRALLAKLEKQARGQLRNLG